MSEQDDSSGQMKKALKVFSVIFITDNQTAEVEQPSKEPLDLPASHVSAQRSPVLGLHPPIDFVGGDQFGAVIFHQLLIQPIAVISLVANQSLRHLGHDPFFHGFFHQLHFSRRSTFCPQGERKTMAVCNAHDFGALAALGFPHQAPPFLAGTNVPSTKHSFRSNPPACWRCWASARRIFSITPERTQFWKRRCAVWYGPYRGGKSCHGAPVRRIHNTPFNTLRRSLHGRPRPSSRTGSSGKMVATLFHCSSVRSIPPHSTLTLKVQGQLYGL